MKNYKPNFCKLLTHLHRGCYYYEYAVVGVNDFKLCVGL